MATVSLRAMLKLIDCRIVSGVASSVSVLGTCLHKSSTRKTKESVMIKRVLISLIVIPVLLGSLGATIVPSAALSAPQSKTIMVFGDSLSASFGIDQSTGWVTLLQQRLGELPAKHRVVNASISGETTLGGLNKIQHALKVHQPDIVILELGGNDGLRGLPLAEMEKNLGAIINVAQQAQAQVLLAGMHLPPNYGAKYAHAFFTVYRTLSQQYKTAYLPFLLEGIATQMDLMQDDGIHPKAKAQPMILDNIWPVLLPLL